MPTTDHPQRMSPTGIRALIACAADLVEARPLDDRTPALAAYAVSHWATRADGEYPSSDVEAAAYLRAYLDDDETIPTTFLDDGEDVARCPACGNIIDFCPGHGEFGDPDGRAILDAHDAGDHSTCDVEACDDAPWVFGLRVVADPADPSTAALAFARLAATDFLASIADVPYPNLDDVCDLGSTFLVDDLAALADGESVRFALRYGAIEAQWGPRYVNTDSPDLDATDFYAHGVHYRTSCRVAVAVGEVVDVEHERDYWITGEVSDAARRRLIPRARALVAEWLSENPIAATRLDEATAHAGRYRDMTRRRGVAREIIATIDGEYGREVSA